MATYPSYGGNGPVILGVSWSFCFIACILVGLRAWAASTIQGKLRWDFLWIAIAHVIAVASQIILTLSVLHGIGNHQDDIASEHDAVVAALYNWIFEIVLIFDIAIVKIAIVAFLLLIQGLLYPKGRYFLHFIWITNMILSTNQVILILLQCRPLPKFWNFTLEGECDFRATTSKVGNLQGGWGAASDLALAIYPIYIYWHLQMSLKLRLGLCALTSGGVIAAVAAALKTFYIAVINESEDITYEFTNLIIWIIVEQWLIIILSSIPPLAQFFGRIYTKTSSAVRSHSQGRSYNIGSAVTHDHRDIELRLNPYPADLGHRAKFGHSHSKSGGISNTVHEDNESQEEIWPGKNQIWMTRETVVQRDGESMSHFDNV